MVNPQVLVVKASRGVLRRKALFRTFGWMAIALITALSLVPASARPKIAPQSIEHFSIFFATGFAFGVGYLNRFRSAVWLLAFTIVIEFAQLLVPGRHARLRDFVIDAVAVCLGIAFSSKVRNETQNTW